MDARPAPVISDPEVDRIWMFVCGCGRELAAAQRATTGTHPEPGYTTTLHSARVPATAQIPKGPRPRHLRNSGC